MPQNSAPPSPVAVPATLAQPVVAPLHGPWPAISLWGRRWPGPGRPASPATVGALTGAAVVAALSIPLDRAGIGWLVTAFAGLIALTLARRLTSPPSTPLTAWQPERVALARLGWERYAWSVATVALLGVGTLRAAGWLFLLCLATAVGTTTLAVTGGRSLRAMVVALLLALVAPLRALPWVVRGAGGLSRGKPAGLQVPRVVATVAVSLILLLVFGGLFASADAAFADVLSRAVPDINAGTVIRWIFVFVVAGGLLGGSAFLRAAPPDLSGLPGRGKRRVAAFEWAVPLGLLVTLFAAFVGVQLAVLFGGSRHVLDTAGLTYADYARGGFWQLAVVTGLTLLVIAGAARWAPRETRGERTLIRVLLGSLAALTLVIVASAVHRMDLYSDTYGLTRLRLLVAACELWLGVVVLLVLVAGIKLRGGWVPRVAVALGVVALLGLAAANPDGLIAERNVTRYQQQHRIDRAYLAGLSVDAVPALNRLPADVRDCVLPGIDRYDDPDDWRGWNYGRERARDILKDHPWTYQPDCIS